MHPEAGILLQPRAVDSQGGRIGDDAMRDFVVLKESAWMSALPDIEAFIDLAPDHNSIEENDYEMWGGPAWT